MQREKIQQFAAIATIFFGLNSLIPLMASAQSSDPSTASQPIQIQSPALTPACTLGDFSLSGVEIQAPEDHYSYYFNPKTPPSGNLQACGTDLTVQDTRYDGGFTLQVTATDYVSTTEPSDTIPLENLSMVTEQLATSYSEDNTSAANFTGTPSTLVPGSTETANSDAEGTYMLPFDFTFYGITYNSGTTIYLCSNGSINFNSGQCGTLPADPEDILDDTEPRIIPYHKDLTTDTTVDGTFGIFSEEPDAQTLVFRWKAAPVSDTGELVQFEVTLSDNANQDNITFDYGDGTEITDSAAGPIIGITKGGPAGIPTTATYTQSTLSQRAAGTDLIDDQAVFMAGFDFTEVKQPATAAVTALLNGDPSNDANPNNDNDYTSFTEDTPGTSLPQEILNGHVDASCGGRIGIYTVYPSYRLVIPQTTPAGTYQSTITYSLMDSTDISC